MINSIWAESAELPEFPQLSQDLQTDVLIIGGGIAGILCAWELSGAGVDCVLIEADRICRGVTRNTTAKITSQHGLIYHQLLRRFGRERTRLYWQANEAAIQHLRHLAGDIPCDFETLDHNIYSVRSARVLELELEALYKLGIPGNYVEKPSIPIQTAGAVRFRNQAQFHPLKFVRGLVKDLRIYENTRAQELIGNTVKTNGGMIQARKIIVATHFPILNKHGSYFLKMYQERSYVLALENAPQPEGMYLAAEKDGFSFRSYQNRLLLGGGSHRTGKQGDGWRMLENFAKLHDPKARIVGRWATQDCMTLDGMPYIGQYSSRTPDLYVATGFNKWGMSSSVVAASVLCDLVRGRENPWAEAFSPSRSILRPQLFVNAAESVWNLLTPTAPRCPHLGCALKWNPQERSWDCPCHGSRFSGDGTLLDGPATGDLKKTES